jgi:hypothetical protein
MRNFSVKRLKTNLSVGEEQSTGNFYGNKSLTEKIQLINSSLASLPFKKTKLISGFEATTFSQPLFFSGCITAKNTSNTAITNTTAGNAIYISGNSNELSQRINSDASLVPFNSTTAGKITSDVLQVEVGDLDINPGDNLIDEDTSSVFDLDVSAEASVVQADTTNSLITFTHKMPITINGQECFLLMSKE